MCAGNDFLDAIYAALFDPSIREGHADQVAAATKAHEVVLVEVANAKKFLDKVSVDDYYRLYLAQSGFWDKVKEAHHTKTVLHLSVLFQLYCHELKAAESLIVSGPTSTCLQDAKYQLLGKYCNLFNKSNDVLNDERAKIHEQHIAQMDHIIDICDSKSVL